jgi:hypothetical protein
MKINYKIIITLLLVANFGSSFAQNNTIFFGGIADGVAKANVSQSYNDVRKGGIGDGVSNGTYSQTYNDIRKGGIGDGNAAGNYLQQYQDIRKGGIGDGYATTFVAVPLNPLPLTLLSFNGHTLNTSNVLDWETAQEINTDYFILERSKNANTFTSIANVIATGKLNGNQTYKFVDENPLQGNNFYRLKMVDKDGKFVYSSIVLLRRDDSKKAISIFPNPAANTLFVQIQNDTKCTIQLLDITGKLISETKNVYNTTEPINVQQLASGTYFIKVIDGKEQFVYKFSKQ